MALPVLIMLGLGYFCKAKNVFDEKGLLGLKAFISNITLPVVLFNAFLCAEYNAKIVVLFVLIYVGYLLAIGTGLLLNKTGKSCSVFMPFLLASAEGGMLGYALYGLITGTQTGFAAVDLGQTVFAYTAFLALLKMTDGKKVTARNLLGNMFSNKCFWHAAWYYLWGNRNWKTCLKQQCRRNRYFGHQYDRSTDERNRTSCCWI